MPGIAIATIPNEFQKFTIIVDEEVFQRNMSIIPALEGLMKAALGRPVGSIQIEKVNFKKGRIPFFAKVK